ncbi:MAG: chemotaxis protein CheW [Chromatiales bacterium]|nr:chemotaxis protein CheW [Chromatiales bacterium]
MSSKTKDNEAIRRWVTFRLDSELYGINVLQVQEVLRYTDIVPVPGAPDFVLGIINLRGNVVTVIDTRKCFGLTPHEPDDATRIVIIESGKQVAGLLVDSVAEVVNIHADQVETAPDVGTTESAKYIQGIANHNHEILILVDVNKLLTPSEWGEVASL